MPARASARITSTRPSPSARSPSARSRCPPPPCRPVSPGRTGRGSSGGLGGRGRRGPPGRGDRAAGEVGTQSGPAGGHARAGGDARAAAGGDGGSARRRAGARGPAASDSPDPGGVAGLLSAIGARFLVPSDRDWPLAVEPPDPPCAWLFVAGGAAGPGGVGRRGRRSPGIALRLAAAEGWRRGSARPVGRSSAGERSAWTPQPTEAPSQAATTVAVLGCRLDVAYPRANQALLARLRVGRGAVVVSTAWRPAPAGALRAPQPADRGARRCRGRGRGGGASGSL